MEGEARSPTPCLVPGELVRNALARLAVGGLISSRYHLLGSTLLSGRFPGSATSTTDSLAA